MPEGKSPNSSDSPKRVGTTTERAVIVLGVHRSGTSALAGALAALGFHPGDRLLPAVAGVNNSGFFEDQRVVDLNDGLLAALDRSWSWPGPLPDDWQTQPAITAMQNRIYSYIEQQSANKHFLLKDPRLCQLLPVWLNAFERLGIRPHILLSYRQATEVSHSLQRRDKMSAATAEALWTNHLLSSELLSRGHQRLLVRYSWLVDDSAATLTHIIDWLDIEPSADQLAAARSFISKGQRHQHASELRPPTQPLANTTDELFAALTSQTPMKRRPIDLLSTKDTRKQLDILNQNAATAWDELQPLVDAQSQIIVELERDFAAALEQLKTQREAAEAHLENSALSADAARAQYAAVQDALGQISKLQESLDTEKAAHHAFRERATRVLGDLVLPPAQSVAREQNSNDYKGVVNLLVENNSHTRVIRYLREHLHTSPGHVLEIGCSEGYFGAALKDDGHTVWGIETNAIAAASAEGVLDLVFRDSIEAFLLDEEHLERRFDAIIFGDVLEHLLDPARILREVAARLTATGMIITSVPNVAHERVRMMLLEGRWEYAPTGIMDNTHLHFFTRDSLVDLFNAAALSIRRFSPIILEGDDVQISVDPQTQHHFEKHITDRERNIFQFVVLVDPAVSSAEAIAHNEVFRLRNQHRILCLPPLPDSSLYSIRIGDPLERQTQLYGGEHRLAPFGAPSAQDIAWADTVVLQREVDDAQLAMVASLQAQGKRVVFDIDDYLLEVPDYLSVHQHCVTMRPGLETMLRQVDAVSVSTVPLREKVLGYNPNVFVTPNYAWTSHPPIVHHEPTGDAPEDRIRVIVASSDSVRVDFLVAALEELVSTERIELIGIGPPGEYLREVGLPVDTAPLMPHEQFKAYIASRHNTIALIPLDDNEFNNCKSAIKYFDYALAGVPCVCSAVEPYTTAVQDQVTGVLCADVTTDWIAAIRALLHSAERRSALATAARGHISKHHNLNRTAAEWQELFQTIDFPTADPLHLEAPPKVDSENGPQRKPETQPTTSDGAPDMAATPEITSRTGVQLARGTVRHLFQPASWQSAWQIYKTEGLAGLKKKWKLVF